MPPVLAVQFGRFRNVTSGKGRGATFRKEKVRDLVDFPLDGLDLRELVIGPDRENAVYDLVGVSNALGQTMGE